MGGKGRKRREKNYRAAHGGRSRLPPPPDPSSLDTVPSKLRKIMAFTHSSRPEVSVTKLKNRGFGGRRGDVDKKLHSEDEFNSDTAGIREDGDDEDFMPPHMDHRHEIVQNSPHEKRKKKRKRKHVDDLRFETAEELGVRSKRRERKKKRLEAMKKKHKKEWAEENLDFPGHENIRFGEVVQAPPKLVVIPKVMKGSKAPQDASKERLRLQAVEAYRNRKGWASRPGVPLPQPMITSP